MGVDRKFPIPRPGFWIKSGKSSGSSIRLLDLNCLGLWITVKDANWEVDEKVSMVMCLAFIVLSTAVLYRSTTKYRRHKSKHTDDTAA